MIKKPQVIVYGAGEGAKNFLERQNEYEVIAIADTFKKGTLGHFDILPPKEIPNFEFDFVIIASMFSEEIIEYLLDNKIVNMDKLMVAPKSYIVKEQSPFNDSLTFKLATTTLEIAIDILNKHHEKYFLISGTLLGLVREAGIIKTDNDIDIAIKYDINSTMEAIKEICKELIKKTELQWYINVRYNEKNQIISIDLEFESHHKYKYFDLGFSILSEYDEENVKQGLIVLDKKYFQFGNNMEWKGKEVSIPNEHYEYLAVMYGEWGVPTTNINFSSYPKMEGRNYDKYMKHIIRKITV